VEVVVRKVSQKGNHLNDRHGPARYSPAIPLTSGTSYSSDSGDILMCTPHYGQIYVSLNIKYNPHHIFQLERQRRNT